MVGKYFLRFHAAYVLLFFFLLATSCGQRVSNRDRYITVSGYAQGGVYSVQLNLKGVTEKPDEIRDSIDAILRSIDVSLSGYNRNSLLSRFNSGESVIPDALLKDMYSKSYAIYQETEGTVDVSSAPLFDIWGFGFADGEMPSKAKVDSAMAISGMDRLHASMDDAIAEDGTLKPGDMVKDGGLPPKLNFNAVAQGYSCDKVASYLYAVGVSDMLVNIGEIFCDGKNPKGEPWTIAVDKPVDGNNDPGAELQAVFSVPDGAHGVVTSGNYRKFYVRDGKKYAHTIDPRTGSPVEHNLLSATIVASDATIADAYATCCMVIGLEESRSLLESRADLEGCLVYDEGGEYKVWCSDGFLLN